MFDHYNTNAEEKNNIKYRERTNTFWLLDVVWIAGMSLKCWSACFLSQQYIYTILLQIHVQIQVQFTNTFTNTNMKIQIDNSILAAGCCLNCLNEFEMQICTFPSLWSKRADQQQGAGYPNHPHQRCCHISLEWKWKASSSSSGWSRPWAWWRRCTRNWKWSYRPQSD